MMFLVSDSFHCVIHLFIVKKRIFIVCMCDGLFDDVLLDTFSSSIAFLIIF